MLRLLLCACFLVCAAATESAADPGTCESGEQLDEVYAVHDASWMNLGLMDPSLTPAQKQTHLDAVFLDQQQRLDSNGMNAYTEESVADFERLAHSMYTSITTTADDVHVLDVGCGWGHQAVLFHSLFPRLAYTGIQIGPRQAEYGRKLVAQIPNVEIMQGSATDLSVFAPASFSHVYALECAFHFDTRHQFFKEAHRVLQPAGKIALMDQVPLHKESDILGQLASAVGYMPVLLYILNAFMFNPSGKSKWQEGNVAEYELSLNDAGFTNVQIEVISGNITLLDPYMVSLYAAEYPWWTLKGLYTLLFVPPPSNPAMTGMLAAAVEYLKVTAEKQP